MIPSYRILNKPIYFKTAEEAFVFANPGLRKLLCPSTDKVLNSKNFLTAVTEFVKKNINSTDNIKPEEIMTALKKIAEKQPENKPLLETLAKITGFLSRGNIGEVLFNQTMKKDNGKILELLKSSGVKI